MLSLIGSSLLHPSKRTQLLERANAKLGGKLASIDAVYVHFVNSTSDQANAVLADVNSPQRNILDSLLVYGDNVEFAQTRSAVDKILAAGAASAQQTVLFVLPRPGSISPWSSKATLKYWLFTAVP